MDFLQLVSKNNLWYSIELMKNWIPLFIASVSFAAPFSPNFSQGEQKIAVQNSILAKVNDRTISMIDVKKKMDLIFHQTYPHLSDSNAARFQFYEMSWKQALTDMIDQELILADATDKEIKITDGEIREMMEDRFGPSVMQTLDRIGLTYDETWKMVKNELIVQRMMWFFIQSRAMSSVTPQDIRQAYRLYLDQHPAYTDWTYRVISIRADKPNPELAEEIHQKLVELGRSPDHIEETLKSWDNSDVSVSLSNEYKAKTPDLSDIHKASLTPLDPGSYSKPSLQLSRDHKKAVYRIFYLVQKTEHPAPLFEDLLPQLRNELTQHAIVKESENYLGKLRKLYGFENSKALPEDLHPFSLQ